MTFGAAISYNFRNALSLSGRAPRSAFWWFFLFIYLVSFVTLTVDMALLFARGGSNWITLVEDDAAMLAWLQDLGENPWRFYFQTAPVTWIWFAIALVPLTTCGWRRMQDRDRAGWPFVLVLAILLGVSIWGMNNTFALYTDIFANFDLGLDAPVPPVDDFIDDWLRLMSTIMLLSAAQMIIAILLIVWLASKGTMGPNRFGEDPLA